MADGFLAIDLGTNGVKVGVIGLEGEVLAVEERTYPLIEGAAPGWVEQDASLWWRAALDAIRAAVLGARGTTIVSACVGGQGPSLVAVDGSGEPLANALIWMDRRAEPERRAMGGRLGREVSPYSNVPRAMWLRVHRPAVYEQTRWFLQAWDYISFRLTGVPVASTFAGLAVFPPELILAGDLDPSRFPGELLMGMPVGTIKPAVAAALGLGPDVVVAGGVDDSTATVLGVGLVTKGRALDLGGTSGGLALAWDVPLRDNGLTAWPAPTPGLFICGGPLSAGGRSLQWFLGAAGYAPGDVAAAVNEAAQVPAGAAGLVFLPYLAGERTPVWDEHARGVLFGLTERHTRAHLARAVLEGVAFSLRHIADLLRSSGGEISELRVNGGQARVLLWDRIKADVIGAPVVVPRVTEGALLGEAILASMASGRAADPLAGASRLIGVAARIEPDPSVAGAYETSYATYRELYPRLRDLMPAPATS